MVSTQTVSSQMVSSQMVSTPIVSTQTVSSQCDKQTGNKIKIFFLIEIKYGGIHKNDNRIIRWEVLLYMFVYFLLI